MLNRSRSARARVKVYAYAAVFPVVSLYAAGTRIPHGMPNIVIPGGLLDKAAGLVPRISHRTRSPTSRRIAALTFTREKGATERRGYGRDVALERV